MVVKFELQSKPTLALSHHAPLQKATMSSDSTNGAFFINLQLIQKSNLDNTCHCSVVFGKITFDIKLVYLTLVS